MNLLTKELISYFLAYFLIAILLLFFYALIIRWIFKINHIEKNQVKQNQLLNEILIELKDINKR